MPKRGTELGAIILRDNSIPTLLAICEYVAEQLGEELNPEIMELTIDVLNILFYKREKRKSLKGNPWGCKGKPKCENTKKKCLKKQ